MKLPPFSLLYSIYRANAEHTNWVVSTDAEGNAVMYIQVGGKPEWEWRSAEKCGEEEMRRA